MTREEIDRVIEMARDCNAPDENDWIAQIFEMFLKGSVQCRTLRNLLKANKNLLAAVKQLREERTWQPIETAPKDGRIILLMENDPNEMVVISDWWHSYANGDGHWEYADAMDDFNSTHWMEMP